MIYTIIQYIKNEWEDNSRHGDNSYNIRDSEMQICVTAERETAVNTYAEWSRNFDADTILLIDGRVVEDFNADTVTINDDVGYDIPISNEAKAAYEDILSAAEKINDVIFAERKRQHEIEMQRLADQQRKYDEERKAALKAEKLRQYDKLKKELGL
jgi:thiamine pyrophosphate-dependent acetolactate synthase large subunit-like protein